ncbi:MAG TPA: outer membrane lipoprotein carrier protein LolA [Bacillota bacterium]|nr:outer membrane lipoprotein carrier protein LolA [Bacillota bacterium]
MRKQFIRNGLIMLIFALLLAACGKKSDTDVVKEMEKTLNNLTDYQAEAEMTMNTGQEEQIYEVSIWHKKEDFYRIALNNPINEKAGQIILKNKDGVFVLTPTLNKSYKFQTDWPDNSSQPYLYESLLKDIVDDETAEFQETDTHYVFKTKTNYRSNQNLPYQEVYIDKKLFTPTNVNVLDSDQQPVVQVKFTQFELNNNLVAEDFSLEKNKQAEQIDEETIATDEEQMTDPLAIFFPLFTAGAELDEMKEISLDNGERVIMTFAGEKNFTLVQEKQHTLPTMTHSEEMVGDIVDLGFAIGALANNKLEWVYEGTEFLLASEELTKNELIEVAKSIQGRATK